jgi:hypothetical protein
MSPQRLRRLRPTRSNGSSSSGSGNSAPLLLRWPTLGDKLQWLAARHPAHVHAIERLVDQLIRVVKANPESPN